MSEGRLVNQRAPTKGPAVPQPLPNTGYHPAVVLKLEHASDSSRGRVTPTLYPSLISHPTPVPDSVGLG